MKKRPFVSRDPKAVAELVIAICVGCGDSKTFGAFATGVSPTTFQRLMLAEEPITDDLAERIERAAIAARFIAENLGAAVVRDYRRHTLNAVRISNGGSVSC